MRWKITFDLTDGLHNLSRRDRCLYMPLEGRVYIVNCRGFIYMDGYKKLTTSVIARPSNGPCPSRLILVN
jgi:hypothetical protein